MLILCIYDNTYYYTQVCKYNVCNIYYIAIHPCTYNILYILYYHTFVYICEYNLLPLITILYVCMYNILYYITINSY